MSNKERFLETYNHPTRVHEVASMAREPVGQFSPVRSGPTGLGTWFKDDQRNQGGCNMIEKQHLNHKCAIKKVKSVIASEMQPPHAHITKVFGDKKDFGSGVRRRKSKNMTGQTILTRKMRNIDQVLHQQEEFVEVREAMRRTRLIKQGKDAAVNNKKPATFALVKKLAENRKSNQFALNEHVKNLASLQRRLQSLNNPQMRRKNVCDPIAFPIRVRRPGMVPQTVSLTRLQRRLTKQQVNQKSQIESIQSRIVHSAFSAKGLSPKSREDGDDDDQKRNAAASDLEVCNLVASGLNSSEKGQHQRAISMSHDYHPRENLDTVRDNEQFAEAENVDLVHTAKVAGADDDPHEEPLVVDKDGTSSADQADSAEKRMTRWRTEAGTIETNSNQNKQNLQQQLAAIDPKLYYKFIPLSQPSASSFNTVTRNSKQYNVARTFQQQPQQQPGYNQGAGATAAGEMMQGHLNPLNLTVSSPSLGFNFGSLDCTRQIASAARHKKRKSRQQSARHQSTDLSILNRVRIRRNRPFSSCRVGVQHQSSVPHSLIQHQQPQQVQPMQGLQQDNPSVY